jgi:hypothetical protein
MTSPEALVYGALPPTADLRTPVSPGTEPATGATAALTADLRDLDDVLMSGSLVSSSISVLRGDLRLAVRSLLGFTLTLSVPGPAVSVAMNVLDQPLSTEQAADCLAFQLPSRADGIAASLTVYAADASALDDLREDLADLLDRPAATLTPGPDIPSRTVPLGLTGLEEYLTVYRAVGAMLAVGYTEEDAFAELTKRAHGRSTGLVGAAQAVLEPH